MKWKNTHFDEAIAGVDQWLDSASAGSAAALTRENIRSYTGRNFVTGWRVPIEFSDGRRNLDLLFNKRFPWRAPQVALVGESYFGRWPHVEYDNILCLFPSNAEINPGAPIHTTKLVLSSAAALIEESISCANKEDFRNEFESYWFWSALDNYRSSQVFSLLSPKSPTRPISLWRGKGFYLVAENTDAISTWLLHRFGQELSKHFVIEPSMLLWLTQALLPTEYPSTAEELIDLIKTSELGAEKFLTEYAASMPERIVVIIGAETQNGPALAATTIQRPRLLGRGPGKDMVDPLKRGFRDGTKPNDLVANHYKGGNRVARSSVERADHHWVHGRGHDPRQETLIKSSVCFVGCGSIGSSLAKMVAKAGVGRMTLIDPENLTWANIGRHELGAQSVQKSKSKELAREILADFPHMNEVNAKKADWHDVAETEPELLFNSNLVISTVGSWGVEGSLNEWHVQNSMNPPIVYGWTEPHACAGHAVAILGDSPCLACGMSEHGVPHLRVSDWPANSTHLQEPACGAVFQPYGPIELSQTIALIADLAIEVLLGRVDRSTHYVWCSRQDHLSDAGGIWTSKWAAIANDRSQGGFIEKFDWNSSDKCAVCRRAAA